MALRCAVMATHRGPARRGDSGPCFVAVIYVSRYLLAWRFINPDTANQCLRLWQAAITARAVTLFALCMPATDLDIPANTPISHRASHPHQYRPEHATCINVSPQRDTTCINTPPPCDTTCINTPPHCDTTCINTPHTMIPPA